MVFSSATFLMFFLPCVFLINYILRKKCSNIFLLCASLFFYAWGEPVFILLLVFSIIVNWLISIYICGKNNKNKLALIIGIIWNIGILGYYKYASFIVLIINDIFHMKLLDDVNVKFPIGISFFTFQSISFLVDVYKDNKKKPKLINTALYISFFPQLIAGPIVKYNDINLQIENRLITAENVVIGFKRFIYGLSKKVLISNVLGLCVDNIYANDLSLIDGKMAWIGAIAYTFQIYYDFSGYSDMAIGLSKMFGFDILDNFDYPYLSRSITEFWRRWHISLGSWFREYVYIPLGGNRKGEKRTYINLIIVFFLTGLWHGAEFSFIIWGLYNVFFQILERLGLKKYLDKNIYISWVYCFLVVNFGWVFFRADNTIIAIGYIMRMLCPWKYTDIYVSTEKYFDKKTLFIMICALFGMGIIKKLVPEKIKDAWKDSIVEAIYCVFILILALAAVASETYNPFIYFQF